MVDDATVVDKMANSRTTLSKPDILACLQLYHEEVLKLLADGYYVKTKLGGLYVGVSGTAQSESEASRYNAATTDHDMHVHFRPNPESRAAIFRHIETKRTKSTNKRQPRPESAISLQTAVPNTAAYGDLIDIRGQRLKFDPEDTRTGVFFRDSAYSDHRAGFYVDVQPRRVVAGVPKDLLPGIYKNIVRTVPNGKDISEGVAASGFEILG